MSAPNISLLLAGPPGSGKSRLAGSAARDLGGAEVQNFDLTASKVYDQFKRGGTDIKIIDYIDAPDFPDSCQRLNDRIDELLKGDAECKPVTILDSMTTMIESLIQLHFYKNPKDKKARRGIFNDMPVVPTLDDWNVIISTLKPLIRKFVSLPGVKIVTAHDMAVTNSNGDVLELLPSVPGKNKYARAFASIFTAAGYCEKDTVNKRWTVRFGQLSLCKWTFFRDSNAEDIPNDWEHVREILKGGGE